MQPIEAEEAELWIALSLSPHIGAKTLASLLRHFEDDLSAVAAATRSELLRVPGVGAAIASYIHAIDLERLAKQTAAWRARDVAILTRRSCGYPTALKELDESPPLLFARGALKVELWRPAIAIVGTRQPSKEARFLALEWAAKLARTGWVIVSGLALGLDRAAHCGALAADGATIAVLGSGVLNVYPRSNRELAQRIQAGGAIVSALHPRWGANAQRLVARNRIISGLSQAVILVESQLNGGAMHTARFVREQGKPVFTFDLPASGNQALLEDGAIAIRADDPLDALLYGNPWANCQPEHLTQKQMFVYNGQQSRARRQCPAGLNDS